MLILLWSLVLLELLSPMMRVHPLMWLVLKAKVLIRRLRKSKQRTSAPSER